MSRNDRIPAALSAAACLAYVACTYIIWGFSRFRGTSGDSWEESGALDEDREESVDPEEALARVTLFALGNDEFRQAWETSVRTMADYLTARVAGTWMAARARGSLREGWADRLGPQPAAIPVPHGIPLAHGKAAFELAVSGEVRRRVEAMNGPGGFG